MTGVVPTNEPALKTVAISGTDGRLPGVAFMDTDEAMRGVGNNCGNLVFQYAVCNLIAEDYTIVGRDTKWNPERLREQCRVLVVPSANFLREGFDFSTFVNFLERTELPLVFLGLGAQADDFDKDSFNFHSSVRRLIDLIKERCTKVSVRGEFTARVLEKFGVTNTVVTGCPSNFINPSPDLPEMIAAKLKGPLRSFITHAEEPWPKHAIKKEADRRLVSWTKSGRAIMIQQSVPGMIRYLRRDNPASGQDVEEGFEANLARTLMPDASLEDFRDFAATRLRTYFSVDQWLEDSARFDFSIGLRLHGNMIAWQAGTPALWIHHDARTRELVETMALPNIGLGEFLEKCASVQDAWERTDFDEEKYSARRAQLYEKLLEVLHAGRIR